MSLVYLSSSNCVLNQILLFFISLLANALSAFAGGGAGLLQLPALIFLGLPFSIALATHKIASVALGIGATIRHIRERTLIRYYILVMLIAGLPGVVIGAHIILFIPGPSAEIALGIMTTSLGIYSILKPNLGHQQYTHHFTPTQHLVGGLVLFSIGTLNGSLTSGTGLFVTMWLIRWYGMDYKHAVAHTLVLVGLFWNGSGALTLSLYSEIQWTWLPVLVLGSLLGGYIGAHWSIMKGNRWIKRSYEFITISVGLLLIINAI